MRILAVSDAEELSLHEYFLRERWGQIDLIISCGDLPPDYLEFLESVFDVPLLYVRGNHDLRYVEQPPLGCEDIHGRLVTVNGLRVFGLEGSPYYGGQELQYTELQMRMMIWRAWPQLWRAHGMDILVTHAPPQYCEDGNCLQPSGIGAPCGRHQSRTCVDASDLPHRGFKVLRELTLKYAPRYLLHGHTHLNYHLGARRCRLGATEVIDCYGHVLLEV